MSAEHYCVECGKKMKRTAKCEFYCKSCDRTIFDWSLQYDGSERKRNIDRIFPWQIFAEVEI